MTDEKPARRLSASTLRGLVDGVGHEVGDRVRHEIGAARASGEANPAHLAQRAAAAVVGGAVGGVGQNLSALLREELSAVRDEAITSAKTAGRAAGLLGGAAAAANTAGLFVGIAVWRGLGNRIGFAKSALVVAGLSGSVAAVLARRASDELARVRTASPTGSAPTSPTSTALAPTSSASTPASTRPAPTGRASTPPAVGAAGPAIPIVDPTAD